jgi:hypothetical protein
MGYPEHPSWQEFAAQKDQIQASRQKAIAYDEMSEHWDLFQEELVIFLNEYCGDLPSMSARQDLQAKYPNLTTWMRQRAAADAERALRRAVLEEIAAKLSELDDATLAEIGFKRI